MSSFKHRTLMATPAPLFSQIKNVRRTFVGSDSVYDYLSFEVQIEICNRTDEIKIFIKQIYLP